MRYGLASRRLRITFGISTLTGCALAPAPDDGTGAADTGDTGAPAVSAYATITGAPADALGNAVVALPDATGDGQPDLLAAAYLGNRACLLPGPLPPGDHPLDRLRLACLSGTADSDYAGYGIGAGDIDQDGISDLLIGAIGDSRSGVNAGRTYLVLGPLSPGDATLDQAAAAAWDGETASDYAGIGVAFAGDLTGDGLPDLLIGATGFDAEGGGGGRAYLRSGDSAGLSPGPLAASYATVTGLRPPAPPHAAFGTGDFVGGALDGARDLDGDGLPDLAVGAPGDQTHGVNAGKVAVFFGPIPPAALLISDADATLSGAAPDAYAGSPLRGSPDLTGDGIDDLLVSAEGAGPGAVYVASPAPGAALLDDSPIRLVGDQDGDITGYAIARSADLDGDGALDLAVSATAADGLAADSGAVLVRLGPLTPGTDTADLRLPGAAFADSFGSGLDAADLSGDGAPDLIVGALSSDAGGGFSGALYLLPLPAP